ncbi:uncharacterized protein [Coffea arabica]|uniref:Integrase catalytic domain-containing protein n=1 Tax=Coffea arabica TaxID=13443 RepID=A0A6P6UDK4_COFAR|nr:uncharacterized protein LOC113709950 [Coffea arabica]
MRQCRLMEFLEDYDCTINYHPGKTNVAANVLSRKAQLAGLMIREWNLLEDVSEWNPHLEPQTDIFGNIMVKSTLLDRIKEGQKKEPTVQKWLEKVQKGELPDFNLGLPRIQGGHDAVWVIVDRLTKSAHFLPVNMKYSLEKLVKLYIDEIVRLHGVPVSIVSDRDPRFVSRFWQKLQETLGIKLNYSTTYHSQTDGQSERTIQTLEDMLRSCIMDFGGSWGQYMTLVEFAYNNNYHASIQMAPYEALYGRKFRSPIHWDEKDHLDLTHILQPEDIELDESLTYEERAIRLLDRKVKDLRNKQIPLVKVLWKYHEVEEATWELEADMQEKYPELFASKCMNFAVEILLRWRDVRT